MTARALPQDVLLLLFRRDGTGIISLPHDNLSAGFVAAALMELALQNRIDSDLARVWVVDRSPTGNSGIDALLGEIGRGDGDLEAAHLVERLVAYGDVIYRAALVRMETAGIIEDHTGFFRDLLGLRQYRVLDPAPAAELRAQLLRILTTDELPSPRDACLLSLIDVLDIADCVIDDTAPVGARARLKAVSRMDLIGQGLGKFLSLILERFAMAYLNATSH